MLQSVSNSVLRNRRSSSVISEQASKRSSISTSNINIDSYTSSQIITNNNILNNNPQQQFTIINTNNNKQSQQNNNTLLLTQNNYSLIQQSLSKIMKSTLQPYRVVKKHRKQVILMFSQQQLKQVYVSLSNSLKSIQKLNHFVVDLVSNGRQLSNNVDSKNSKNKIDSNGNESRKQIGSQCQYSQFIYNTNNEGSGSYSSQIKQLSNYNNKIQQLQQQIQRLRNSHSEQIRQMIRAHQQQIGCAQKEHKLSQQEILLRNNELLQRVRTQSEFRIRQIVGQCELRMSSLSQALKSQQQKVLTINIQKQQLQSKYKPIINKFIQRLNRTKQMYQKLGLQYENKLSTTIKTIKSTIKDTVLKINDSRYNQKLLDSLQQRLTQLLTLVNDNNNHHNQNHNYNSNQNSNQNNKCSQIKSNAIKQHIPTINFNINNNNDGIISQSNITNKSQERSIKINNSSDLKKRNSNDIKNPITQIKQQEESSTNTIQQMFQYSGQQSLMMMNLQQQYCVQTMVDLLVQKLVRCGFFSQQNEQSVMGLFGIGREVNKNINQNNRFCKQQSKIVDSLNQCQLILVHGLYPLIMQKIKLNISNRFYSQQRLEGQLQQQLSSSSPTNINKDIYHPIKRQSIYGFNTNENNNNLVSEFSTSQQQRNSICFRNIQSIQQLQVSDSMICDHQQEFVQHQRNNNFKYPQREGQQQQQKQKYKQYLSYHQEQQNSYHQYKQESYHQQQQQSYHQQQQQSCHYQQQQYPYQQQLMVNNMMINPSYPLKQKKQQYHQYQQNKRLHQNGYESEDSGSFDIELF